MNLLPMVSLLLGAAMLVMGSGLLTVVVPVRASIEGFHAFWIGLIGGGYYLGFVFGCLATPYIVRRAGHIRVFAALAAVASSVALLHLMLALPWAWILFRVGTGFCMAGIYMVIESWLNEHATNETRGQVFSVYMVVNLSGLTLGQMLLAVPDPASFMPFVICAMAISLSLVPVALTRSAAPAPLPATGRLTFRELYRASPLGVTGCTLVGLANGAFWGHAPVFAKGGTGSTADIALFMTAFVIGGALVQWPLGRLSDRYDRRSIIIGGCGVAVAVALLLFAFRGLGTVPQTALAFCAGAAMLPLYPICVAHANDHIVGNRFIETSGGLLMAYGIGAVVGPVAASALIAGLSVNGLFLFTAIVHLSLAGIAWYRMTRRAPVPQAERTAFVSAPAASPAMPSPLDPRATES